MLHQLEIEHDYDFDLIGICSRTGDYKLCWALNKQLGYELHKEEEDIRIPLGKENMTSKHSLYTYLNENTYTNYKLIKNQGTAGHLIPEQRQADYFLMIRDRFDETLDEIIEQTRELPFVLTAFKINPEGLKSKENLIF